MIADDLTVGELWKILMYCDSSEKEEVISGLLKGDRKQLLEIIELPQDSQERFRVYDLLSRIQPDGKELLDNVLKECRDDSDPLNQLAAIQFVYDHHMQDLDNFVELFHTNVDNPLTSACIAETVALMIMESGHPHDYADTVQLIITKATTENSDLLGVLPRFSRDEIFAKMMLQDPSFQMWIMDYPYKPELRTFNIYMRNLLAKYSDKPADLLIGNTNMTSAMAHPSPGLRCAIFEHVAVMSAWFREDLLQVPRICERLFDASMDSTSDEAFARHKAIDALGLNQPVAGAPVHAQRQTEDIGPEVMVI